MPAPNIVAASQTITHGTETRRLARYGLMNISPAPRQFPYVPRTIGPITIFVAIGLVSCGGGGGGSSSPSPPPATNQPPVASNACVSTPVNNSTTGTLSATDPNGDLLTFAIASQGTKGSASTDPRGNYIYTPSRSDFRGLDKFAFTVTDPSGLQSTGTIWVLIDGAVRVMPVGDSITAGSPGATPATAIGYRKKLYTDLEALSSNYGVRFVGNLAHGETSGLAPPNNQHEGHPGYCDGPTGCSNDNVADNIVTWLNAAPADVLLLHIGTNDFSTNAADVSTILDNINTWASGNYPVTTFVARIIPASNGGLYVNTFNNNVAAIATNRPNVRVLMVNQQTGAGIHNTTDPAGNTANAAFMADNLHPNQAGYDKMADKWKADLIAAGLLPNCP